MNDELTILIGFYFLIGLGTGMFGAIANAERGENSRTVFVWPLIWPIIWFIFIFVYFTNRHPAKCAWCGKVVASGRKEDLELWRAHYLKECKEHPLRKEIEELETQLKPFREIQKRFVRQMEVKIDGIYKSALYGPEPYRTSNDKDNN